MLRAQPFAAGRAQGMESASHFFRLAPQPPLPEVHLTDLRPLRATSPRLLDGHTYDAVAPDIGFDAAAGGGALRIGGRRRERGVSVHTPAHVVYALESRWRRFVALVGLDDSLLDQDHGMLRGEPRGGVLPGVRGWYAQVAASPTLRAAQVWRFDLPLAPGSGVISLAAMDAIGDGAVADWVAAGFLAS